MYLLKDKAHSSLLNPNLRANLLALWWSITQTSVVHGEQQSAVLHFQPMSLNKATVQCFLYSRCLARPTSTGISSSSQTWQLTFMVNLKLCRTLQECSVTRENNHMLFTKIAGEWNMKANVRQSNSSVPSGQWYSVQSQRWDKGIHVPSPHVNSPLLHLSSGASVAGSVGSAVHREQQTLHVSPSRLRC